MSVPVLNVLMPVYNGEQYLHESVESILSQTFSDFELFVIDDGSTDQTFEILASFAERDKRVHLLQNETNLGIVHSMNKLFKLVRAPYIVRHDADDISMPDRFEQQLTFLIAHPEVGLVSSQVEIIDGSGNHLDLVFFSGPLDNDTLQHELLSRCPLCQTSVMFRSQLLGTVGLYDENLELAEDYDLWLRMAEVTHLARLPLSLCKYRYHLTSVSHRRSGKLYRDVAESLKKAAARRFKLHVPDSLRKQISHYYAWGAEKFCQAQDFDSAQQCLVDALTSWPDLFVSGQIPVPIPDMRTRLKFADSVFQSAPSIVNKAQVRRQFLSNLIMKDVFEAATHNQTEPIDANLWRALRLNPNWLCNRGVISLGARSAWRLIGRMIYR